MLGTTFLLAIRSILRHKLRSFLTTLGIIIGVAAVVTISTLGQATTSAVQSNIASLGSNILQVRPGQGFGRGGGGPRPSDFKPEDVEAIRDQIAGVTAVAPQAQSTATAIYNGANWSTTINGTTNAYFTVQPWPLVSGRTFTPAEEAAGKSVCIIGNTVKTNLFAGGEAVGSRFRIGSISCDVVGTLSTRGQSGFGGDQDDVVIMPIKTVQRRFTGNRDIRLMLVGVNPAYDGAAVQASLTQLLRERRNIAGGKEDDFNIFDTAQITATITSTTTLLTTIVSAVAAISLLVGGIGIMNIMLVSVTERTREIGIRLAIGAVASEVLLQFLVEAVALSCLGGLIGLLIAQGAVAALSLASDLPFLFLPQVNLMAFGVSALIGVVFGYFPARRAASLNPIDALRHE
ncbi:MULTISPECIES: ABC transporter permease [unclassified Sphingomonas]|uniref:ABC transporter permease n=1 Tax=unclassified Sphingomonas TaxID=196159 RepID=UPI0006FF1BB2|nr:MULTISPECIES: ABC transporter permease [unclassified Sphingomonas]KQN00327.1 multidrug ABC transporter substrate-binding protein [Sphingomonas sp. Leaf25]KQN36568.1 multidrug ABC transporter substrate-binding protein [Sphingomonas sp. Leaf42]KQT27190.1 multidrug ABC transporter substrate-binding protein [Sphingomonas sp. Leaf407]